MPTDHAEFVCEPLVPVKGTGEATAMAAGKAGLPGRFTWRGRAYRIVGVISSWKRSGPCRSGGNEMYLRRHYYKILTDPHAVMTVYCDRQVKDRKHPKAIWWVYTVEEQVSDSAST